MKKKNNLHLVQNLVVLLREKSPKDRKHVPSVDEQRGLQTRKSMINGVHAINGEDYARSKNDEEENAIIFLLTRMGNDLLIHDNLNISRKKKKFIEESHLVIQRDGNYVNVQSRNNLLYAVALHCQEREAKEEKTTKKRATGTTRITERNNYTRVLAALKYARDKFNANLNYYVSLANGEWQVRKIHLLDCSQMVWDFQFFKDDLRRRIKYAQLSKSVCFVLSPCVLIREYALFVSGLIRRLGRGSQGAVFHVVEEECTGATAIGELVADSVVGNVVDIPHLEPNDCIHLEVQQKTPFHQQIWFILSLLKEEYTNLRSIYHLEHYTKIFLHNCEKLNRRSFISFLKKIDHLHVHAVNLNTLFGLYFSETEENILKVFRKCERLSKQTSRSVCLVIDGIDVVARRLGKRHYGNGDDDHRDGSHDGDDSGGEANDNGRLLTTLLLCLDSIDNYTGRRRPPRRRAAEQREQNNEGNTKHNICKDENTRRRMQKKKHSPEVDLYEEDSDNTAKSSTDGGTKKKHKRKKLATHVTYDIKQLAKIYKEKRIQLMRRKKKKNISIIVLSDLDLKHFDISLTRAGRFFHFIKYS
ncbi:conserved Plasmodium protein, unknown function [Plasmodium knowlesi strain H]|uniref:ATPase AAA-type core domain-containing protein n=3 Tax=Plasmodium knowlesi TaxID=5850 RepID=A0A5K1U3R0_PLAKH|nr:conserved Plasmodium protein, unknown function [Plasmodium knowlesi strain H]OTN65888.1 Uncharacterized protein PKNOH_S100057400 [Plasmodium knowlesi]CAA9987931.1 conserved Plasmodium protein, unknown function [Plasmodium knowlesi strain H]SBO22218.1 conserved Plasmodium protein, unknown function [Plasmodium knowlesi strain H]SBO28864.1 conserved Plasmodium protein, unknown function [Plasmodium knowlesi strain H]VVS77405.1 conserved Plasmodium protein, unknown function [Plasmodium knowlesi |eukprot:XP_002258912.1 hypothetical protein, conserved in Plasmodium species [Plasmodium knowlesi strain H]